MKTSVVGPAEQEAHLAALRIKRPAAQYRLYGGKLQRMDGGKWRPVCLHDARPERCKEGCGGSELCEHLVIGRQCRRCHPQAPKPPTAEQQAFLEGLRRGNPTAEYRLYRDIAQRLENGQWERVCLHDRLFYSCHECHAARQAEVIREDPPQAIPEPPSMHAN
jgi:hypothetical protein